MPQNTKYKIQTQKYRDKDNYIQRQMQKSAKRVKYSKYISSSFSVYSFSFLSSFTIVTPDTPVIPFHWARTPYINGKRKIKNKALKNSTQKLGPFCKESWGIRKNLFSWQWAGKWVKFFHSLGKILIQKLLLAERVTHPFTTKISFTP